ncbi:MAG TPA: hypothetical protein DCE28_13340 [Halomonas sp.]|nr:hypothetical protein [Halomonas sp.]
MEMNMMDKQSDHVESKENSKRPQWLTLCMMATAASVIVLAGCGDTDDDAALPPAEEPAPLEQDATAQPEPSMNMNEEPAMDQDPGLNENPASEGTMSEGTMPENTMDEPAEGTMNSEDDAEFGEGMEPMPGVEDEENSTSQ